MSLAVKSFCVFISQWSVSRPSRGGSTASWLGFHQQLQRLPVWTALRRLQTIGHRTRKWPCHVGLLHAAEVRLRWDGRRVVSVVTVPRHILSSRVRRDRRSDVEILWLRPMPSGNGANLRKVWGVNFWNSTEQLRLRNAGDCRCAWSIQNETENRISRCEFLIYGAETVCEFVASELRWLAKSKYHFMRQIFIDCICAE